MLQDVEWGGVRLGDLFEINTSAKRFDANKVNVLKKGEYPYVVRMSSNNGQKGYIDENTEYLNEGNTISFGQDTATMYYQESPFFTGDKIKVFKAKCNRFGKQNAQFILSSLALTFSHFSWGSSSFNVDILENQMVSLPTRHGEIDYDFMERFIQEIENERIIKLNAYLVANGLTDTKLTKEEERVLKEFENWEWEEYRIGSLFNVNTGSLLNINQIGKGSIPRISARADNNGVLGYFDSKNTNGARHVSNFISVNFFGTDGGIFYHPYEASIEMKVHTLKLLGHEYTRYSGLFCVSALSKCLGGFGYGLQLSSSKLKNGLFYISLPTRGGEIDYASMQTLIGAIQKRVVKRVVDYTEEKMKSLGN